MATKTLKMRLGLGLEQAGGFNESQRETAGMLIRNVRIIISCNKTQFFTIWFII